MPLSTPVRISLAHYVRGTRAPVETAQQLGRVLEQLIAIGRNINQITRSIHSGYGPRDYERQTQELSRVRGDGWHLTLAPRAAGGALYLSRAEALRRYAGAEAGAEAGEDLAEPATLHASWAGVGAAHVFRAVTPDDLARLAYYSTAEQLVYCAASMTAPPTRYVASPRALEGTR